MQKPPIKSWMVCGYKDCMCYGDTTPAQYENRCIMCNQPQVPALSLPFMSVQPHVLKTLKAIYKDDPDLIGWIHSW